MSLPNRGLRPAAELAADRPHGVRIRYMAGCRCDLCRRANSVYEAMRQKARRSGDWNGIVSADAARAHLRKLARQGVGRNVVSEVTDIPRSVVAEIRSGRKARIRARTERKILAVTPAMRGDAAIVPATRTWRLIGELIEEGYTKAFIARRMGRSTPALQIHKERVLVRTAADVARVHRELTT